MSTSFIVSWGVVTIWIEEEDLALKQKLSTMVVTDASAPAGRPVKIWYRMPEMEERQVVYPFVTLELFDVSEALDRAHRGGRLQPTQTGFGPSDLAPPDPNHTWVTEWPVAMNLDYQVSTYARSNLHDRQMLGQMWTTLPGRYGHIGGDSTHRPRTAQLLSFSTADRIDEFGKRLFRKIFHVRVFSEIYNVTPKQITQVQQILLTTPVLFGNESNWITQLLCYES